MTPCARSPGTPSIASADSIALSCRFVVSGYRCCRVVRAPARLPERPKGADCKSAGIAFRSSNLLPGTTYSAHREYSLRCAFSFSPECVMPLSRSRYPHVTFSSQRVQPPGLGSGTHFLSPMPKGSTPPCPVPVSAPRSPYRRLLLSPCPPSLFRLPPKRQPLLRS